MYTAPLILAVIFSFVIVIVVINKIGEILKEKVKTRDTKDNEYIDYELRLKKLEERISNLETIVLERERYKKFSDL